MPFLKGRAKTGGRAPGKQNRFTGLMKEAIQVAYNGLGGHAGFTAWAVANPSDFYKIAARLIPVEHRHEEQDDKVTIIIHKLTPPPDATPPVTVAGTLIDHSGNGTDGSTN